MRRILTPVSRSKRLLSVPKRDSRLWQPVRVILLGVALGGGCSVYEVPTKRGNPAGMAGDDGLGFTEHAGQAGASDRDRDEGGAGNGGTGEPPGGGAAGAATSAGAGESSGGSGGTAADPGSGGESVGSAGSPSCVSGWRNQSACDQCATQTQPDLKVCAAILDCYVRSSCGPSSCTIADQVCGPNVLGQGAAAYSIAQAVYDCICK